MAYLCLSSENTASFFVRDIAFCTLSLTIFRDDTSVVKIAAAINTPHTGFRCNRLEIAKTGIKLSFTSDKTTVCNIYNIPNIKTHIIMQESKISL